jgi:hypothetical protein
MRLGCFDGERRGHRVARVKQSRVSARTLTDAAVAACR